VLKLSAMGNALVYSTYLGGSSIDFATAIAIDSSGRAYVAGYTASTDFPIANAVQTSNAGGYDAFVARLSSTGSTLEMSTYLGGMESDSVSGVALDTSGNAYLAGQTMSMDFPTSAAMQVYKLAASSAFVGEMPSLASGSNLAAGKAASQSSTYCTANAANAVDGSTDGVYVDGSLSTTNFDSNAWWQVDLGASAAVSSIVIWNRTDCCGSRLSNYWIFVSNTPFGANDTPGTLQIRPGTWGTYQAAAPNPSTTIALGGVQGRYVRVQLAGVNYLSLAEVQVFVTGN
jgi:F5/8 type C domain-containing protein/beta-propeller repeat-containing protein